jgi:predicted dehydrogenase
MGTNNPNFAKRPGPANEKFYGGPGGGFSKEPPGRRRPKKTLLIGCGKAGALHEFDPKRKKPASLIGGLLRFPDFFELVGACDLKEERLEKVASMVPGVVVYTDYKKALRELSPEVVVIAAWTNVHKEMFLECLKHGVGGIILEKPVARTLSEARAMERAWKKNPVPVVVNHERRWLSKYRLVKEVIENRELGPVRAVYAKVLLGSVPGEWEDEIFELEGGGTLLHDGTHLLDILIYLFRELEIQRVLVRKGKLLDKSTHALLLADGNIPVYLEVGGERSYFEFGISVECQGGTIRVGNGFEEWWEVEESRLYSGYNDLVKKDFPSNRLKAFEGCLGFAGPFWELKEALINKDRRPLSNLRDGIRAMELIFGMLKKAKNIM